MKITITLLICILFSGCATGGASIDSIKAAAEPALDRYCDSLGLTARRAISNKFAFKTEKGNALQAEAYCVGDPSRP